MTLEKKLQLKPGQKLRLVNRPRGLVLDVPTTTAKTGDAVLAFVRRQADIAPHTVDFVACARADGLAWVAYPKAGQLETDLNRDSLGYALMELGIKPVRQIAIDDV
jgi:hypothetical protein